MRRRKTVYIRAPDGKVMAYDSPPGGKPVHVTREMMKDPDFDIALLEQLLNIQGPKAIARFLADRLRKPSEYPGIPEMVARLLGPDSNASFRLEIVRHRGGKSPTRRFTDATMVKWVKFYQRARGKEHLSKKDVGEIADEFDVSVAKIRKVITEILRDT